MDSVRLGKLDDCGRKDKQRGQELIAEEADG
jgi:hypothetical protein